MEWLQIVVVVLLVHAIQNIPHGNNVCKTLDDYANIKDNKNCWYNPDANSSLPEIAQRNGYQTENFSVGTEDGYTLIIYRFKKCGNYTTNQKQPVILQYGIGGMPESWALHGKNSIAFVLCDAGYDIWIPNSRGFTTKVKNEKLSRDDPKYWDYSFHEMGIYDVPAVTEFISKMTKYKRKIIFIGHSMGATMSYVYATEKKDHAERHLKGLISLAPVVYMKAVNLLLQSSAKFAPFIASLTKEIGIYVFGENPLFRQTISSLCSRYPDILTCDLTFSIGNGKSPREFRADLLPVFLSYFPSATTIKNLQHFGQIIKSKKFQKFDYGSMNKLKYNSSKPPEYDIDKVSLPASLFIGFHDVLATIPDTEVLYQKLKQNGGFTKKHIYDYAHNDFFLAKYYEPFLPDLLNDLSYMSKIN